MNYEITVFGLLIINLMNWLDGVLTYIGLYILPKGIFYEANAIALSMFNSIGFFSIFILKICCGLFVTLFLFLKINRCYNSKSEMLFNHILILFYFLVFIIFLIPVFKWDLYLIIYFF